MPPEANVEAFFSFARERHRIYLKRQAGDPWPWTDDSILRKYKFTNCFRELDKTTVWFREHVRESLRDKPECLLATVLFRWFCRIETGQVIFEQPSLLGHTGWEVFLKVGDTSQIRSALKSAFPDGPYVTGAYMIKSPDGVDKLTGILSLCEKFYHESGWRDMTEMCLNPATPVHMESFTDWMKQTAGIGAFLAYEIACDLQHTDLLCRAPDIMTWANPGPGARRGLNRIYERADPSPRKPSKKWSSSSYKKYAQKEMQSLLLLSQDDYYWPREWQQWDMRTTEHTLCEFDKWSRVKNGEGEPKALYRRST